MKTTTPPLSLPALLTLSAGSLPDPKPGFRTERFFGSGEGEDDPFFIDPSEEETPEEIEANAEDEDPEDPDPETYSASPAFTELVALRIDNRALSADRLPTRLKLLNWGTNASVKGPINVGFRTLELLPQNQIAFGYDRVATDFEHQTVPGSPTFKADPVAVAAHGVPLVIGGDGLYLDEIHWTPDGERFARNYPDLSPTVGKDPETQEVTFLHSVALCRQGAVHGLSFYSASFLTNHNALAPTAPLKMDFKKILIALLGLAETATDEEINAAATAFAKKDDKPADAPEAKKPDVEALSARLDRLDQAETARERSRLVERARLEGKVIPLSADLLAQTPLTVLSGMIETLPAIVPLDQRTPANLVPHSVDQAPTVRTEIQKNLGITAEQYKKHNG